MKHTLALVLMVFGSFASLQANETNLYCKYERSVFHPQPLVPQEPLEDESVVITKMDGTNVLVSMYGSAYAGTKQNNIVKWTPWSETGELRHTLDGITGKLVVIFYSGGESLFPVTRDVHGWFKSTSYYYNCSKANSLFD
ncbi:hypothetical protein OAK21_04595 [Pseudomonadota bacterium]|nr:hypothetical protein [Pseudomonadota bacterium]